MSESGSGHVYLLVDEHGIWRALLDREKAARLAEAEGAVVAAAPIVADYRRGDSGDE